MDLLVIASRKSMVGWFKVSNTDDRILGTETLEEHALPTPSDFGQVANELCEKALSDAKAQLHPLLREVELNRLDQRREFVEAFKRALEERIARKLVLWQPGVEAVFRFDEALLENAETWDGSIHLLLKVERLSNAVQILGKKLDQSLTRYLKQKSWSRFQKRKSMLDVQQVTPNEMRYGIGYGAMFFAVYTVPVKIWSPEKS